MSGEPSASERLRDVLSKPLFNPVLKTWVGEGKLDYEIYVRTKDLLSLQIANDQLADPDELMFQVTHQAQEIWLKLLAHELAEAVGDLDRDEVWPVVGRLDRAGRIVGCLVMELRVLETLTPDTYQVIRRNLGNGSGQESPGFNAVLVAASHLSDALDRWLARRGATVVDVYGWAAKSMPELKRVCEMLVDLDEQYQTWLFTHFMLVRRTIGVGRNVKALDGVPTQVLTGRMTKPLFRALWKAREDLTEEWRRAGGHEPGAKRTAS